jgi:putative heme-binding domain-containing protein
MIWRCRGLWFTLLLVLGLAFRTSAARADTAQVPPDYDAALVAKVVAEARESGDPARGAKVFVDARLACLSCHKVGTAGGEVGPELTAVARCLTPEQIAEAVFWPARQVKEGYNALAVARFDGTVVQGYEEATTGKDLLLRVATTGERLRIPRAEIEQLRTQGTLMPGGLASTLDQAERRDLLRFLMELGKTADANGAALVQQAQPHAVAAFPYDREPVRPELWPNRRHPVNRDRIYDFYAKEAEFFRRQPSVPPLLPPYPGLDGGTEGHWGNQNEDTWTDDRWNDTDFGSLLCGVFRGAGVTVPKGVCVRFGDRGELSACFNPETLCYEVLWTGGFVKFSPKRHGFLGGLIMDGTALPRPAGAKPREPFVYHGFYRHGARIVFSYRLGDVEMLDAPWMESGRFTRTVAPAAVHPLAHLTKGGPPQWPQELVTKGTLGSSRPYALDTIEPPFDNPWKALLFFGGHDFVEDGTAMLCTMQGDVWRVEGLDETLAAVRWRRIAAGLHQALGLVAAGGRVHVLGRDQITRLHDLNGDGEADFYECVSNAYVTSPAGHDFITGLARDAAGNFYTVSGAQGVLKVPPAGKPVEVMATGFRNADGVACSPEGILTVPNSEGDWTPASMVCQVRPGGHYGSGGPKSGQVPDLPLVYLPRGLDNSSGGQAWVTSDRWGPLQGQMLHFTYGAGTYFLVLREQVDGQSQGAVVPLPGDFHSGVHRGQFSPRDGQLYVSGMGGWGTYTPADGCFQRVRYTGDPVQVPVATHVHENGVLVTFAQPVDRSVASDPRSHFAQAWNYRYSAAYGSPELAPRHPGAPGHDPLVIRSATVLADGKSLFLELPDLQPVSQLHLHLSVAGVPGGLHPRLASPAHDLFLTVHKLGPPFTGFAGYHPEAKTIAAHPILGDLAMTRKAVPNPWRRILGDSRAIRIEAGKNLTFSLGSFTVRAGEPIRLVFTNPDVVPHNWALVRPGTLEKVGDLANKFIADPEAVYHHYVPRTDDVLLYTDIVNPQDQTTIFFRAPAEKGRYPYLCTFPGHWMVMNGIMVVE